MKSKHDSASDLRFWAESIKTALGIVLAVDERGTFALRTKGANMVGIEAAPNVRALILTGQIGVADNTVTVRSLKALLALNMASDLSGTACVVMALETEALLLRLVWAPDEEAWHEDTFIAVLAAFSAHVDSLAASLRNGELERLLPNTSNQPPIPDSAVLG